MELNIRQAIIGGQNRLLVVGRDIDERKKAQAALIENEKLAGLGTLAAGIAHEIRSPLQIVTGTTEIMIKRLQQDERDLERDLHGLESIHRNSWRIAEITNALLTYARPSSQQVEQHDLNVLIRETLPLIDHQLKSSSNISVITNLDPNLPLLNCNRGQISQVLVNLLTNARDAMTFGGTITIGTHYLQDDKKIILEVNDTGTGIPEQNQRKIFDPFFTTKPIGQGTGLGLSIVSGIIRAHSGEISVESKEGFGTRIILSFPESASASNQDNGINGSRYE
jgi:signal transduction histidine kinase